MQTMNWRRAALAITVCIGMFLVLKMSMPVHLWPNYQDFIGISGLGAELHLQPIHLPSKTPMPYTSSISMKHELGRIDYIHGNGSSNVYFLKLQKTGSTTMYNIFCRYAWKNNLRVATFMNRPFRLDENETLNIVKSLTPAFIEGKSVRYNMMIEHTRFEPEEVIKVLQHPTKYITMIRHPLIWLESFLHHAKIYTKKFQLDKENIVASFLDKLEDESWYQTNKVNVTKILKWQRDILLFTSRQTDSNTDIREIEKVFFVGITERFDESLVLMKRTLGWSFRDILYVTLRKSKHRVSGIDESLYKRVCKRIPFNCLVYEHFDSALAQKILSEGKHFKDEVNHLKSTLERIEGFCSPFYDSIKHGKKIDTKVHLSFRSSEWHASFVYNYTDCALARFQEFTYRAMFYYRQNPYDPKIPCPLMHERDGICYRVGRLSNRTDMIHKLALNPWLYIWK